MHIDTNSVENDKSNIVNLVENDENTQKCKVKYHNDTIQNMLEEKSNLTNNWSILVLPLRCKSTIGE